jgi:hypothetical protein
MVIIRSELRYPSNSRPATASPLGPVVAMGVVPGLYLSIETPFATYLIDLIGDHAR